MYVTNKLHKSHGHGILSKVVIGSKVVIEAVVL